MCETARTAVGSPRWGALYGVTVPPLATLAVIEMASPPNPVRTLLRCALALGTFAGMALWVRTNRAAFDLQDWCDCAGRTMTVRVIESHRPAPPPDLDAPAPEWVEPEYETAGR